MKKQILINFENEEYECKIESNDKENINITLENNGFLKFNGSTSLKEIYQKIPLFDDYSMEEFFSSLTELKDEDFKIVKESDNFFLDLTFKVLKKEKHLKLFIKEVSESKDDIIKKLINITRNNEKRITKLENKMKEFKLQPKGNAGESKEEENSEENEDNFDLNIEVKDFCLKDLNEDKIILDYESLNTFSTVIILKDGRIAAGQRLASFFQVLVHPTGISIFDKDTLKELIFMEGYGPKFIELRNGNLLTHKDESKIHIIKLNHDSFDILQTIDFEKEIYPLMLELSNGVLSIVDNSNMKIIFYKKENNKYCFDYDFQIKTESKMYLEGNKNELIYSEDESDNNRKIIFFNYNTKKIISSIPNIQVKEFNIIKKITKNLFAISRETDLLLFDYRKRKYFGTFQIKSDEKVKEINGLCNVNKKAILLGYGECGPEAICPISYITIDDDGNFKTVETIRTKTVRVGGYNMAVTKDGQLVHCGACRYIYIKYKIIDKKHIDIDKKGVSDNESEGNNENEEPESGNEEDEE